MDVREAIKRAIDVVSDLYPQERGWVRLEEVERTDGEWTVTVSVPSPSVVLRSPIAPPTERDYKRIYLDDSSGEFRKMEIRKL